MGRSTGRLHQFALASLMGAQTMFAQAAFAQAECRLTEQDMASPEAVVDWALQHGNAPMSSAIVVGWHAFGLEAMQAEILSRGDARLNSRWRTCLSDRMNSRNTYSQCGLPNHKSNADRFFKGKLPKSGYDGPPPDRAVFMSAQAVGKCFGERSANISLDYANMREGPFTPAQCDYGHARVEAAPKQYGIEARQWADSYAKLDKERGRGCPVLPKALAEDVRSDAKPYRDFVGRAARAEAVSAMEDVGKQRRDATPPALLYADTPSVLPGVASAGAAQRRFTPGDPAFRGATAVFDLPYESPADLSRVKAAAARGCTACARGLVNIYRHGLYGETPNIKRAARYAILAYGLSYQPVDGIVDWGSGDYTTAWNLVRSVPREHIGEMRVLRAYVDAAADSDHSREVKRAWVSPAMFAFQPVDLIDARAFDVDTAAPADAAVKALRGTSAMNHLAGRILPTASVQADIGKPAMDILVSAATTGHKDAALFVARHRAHRGRTPSAVAAYDVAGAADLSDGTAYYEKARLLMDGGRYFDAQRAGMEAAGRGHPSGLAVAREAADTVKRLTAARQRELMASASRDASPPPYSLSDGFRDLADAIRRDTEAFNACMSRAGSNGFCVRD